MNINELSGADLDRAVAECQGFTDYDPDTDTMLAPRKEYGRVYMDEYSYSTDWSRAGEIIEREKIGVVPSDDDANVWVGSVFAPDWKFNRTGPTPLIAAMRCYVASKQGE